MNLINLIMKIEEKQLLLRDLCARLPYRVIIHTNYKDIRLDKKHCSISVLYYENYSEEAKKNCGYNVDDFCIIISGCYYGDDIKPYLRSLDDMTEEEVREFYSVENITPQVGYIRPTQDWHFTIYGIDWLNANHFDYRGLIEKGLAIRVTDRNPYKEYDTRR